MAVALQAYPEALAGGVFYYTVKDRIITLDKDTPEEVVVNKQTESMRLKGLFVDDEQVLEGLDREFDGKSRIVNLSRTAKGGYRENNELVDYALFERILTMAMDSAVEAANAIRKGDNSINPYKLGEQDHACMYCEYKSVCGFDDRFKANRYRHMEKISLKQLREEVEE
jgi:ATP-dependent helicase/nuclease subunit B